MRKIKVIQGGKNANTNTKLSNHKLELEDTVSPYKYSGRDQTPGMVHVLVRNLRNRFLRFVLDRSSIQQLDQALKQKTGKTPTRSQASRNEARAYNQGYNAAMKKVREVARG